MVQRVGAVGAMIAVLAHHWQRIPVLTPLATLIGPTEGDAGDEIDDLDESNAQTSDTESVQAAAAPSAAPLHLTEPCPADIRL